MAMDTLLNRIGTRQLLKKKLGRQVIPGNNLKGVIVFIGAGDPTNDTDIASANGDLYYDRTNDDVWVASNVSTDPTGLTTTWTEVLT